MSQAVSVKVTAGLKRSLARPLLIVTPWPLAAPGGAQRLTRGIAASLAVDHRVELTVAAGSGLSHVPSTPAHSVIDREVRLPLCQAERRRWPAHWRRTDEYWLEGLEALASELLPSAILFVSHYSGPARQAAALADQLNVPFLLLPAIHLDLSAHTSLQARRFYRRASNVFCLSSHERDWLVHNAGVASDRTDVIGYGCDGGVGNRQRRFNGTSEVRLLSVGAFVPHKQLDHQLEAIALLRHEYQVDARLTIAGTVGDPGVLPKLRGQIQRHALEGCVDLKVNCTDDEIISLHTSANAFLFTSRSESFGVALFESIAFGTPPIAYPHPVYRQLIERSGFGVIATHANPRALVAAILHSLKCDVAGSAILQSRWRQEQTWARAVAPIAARLAA